MILSKLIAHSPLPRQTTITAHQSLTPIPLHPPALLGVLLLGLQINLFLVTRFLVQFVVLEVAKTLLAVLAFAGKVVEHLGENVGLEEQADLRNVSCCYIETPPTWMY